MTITGHPTLPTRCSTTIEYGVQCTHIMLHQWDVVDCFCQIEHRQIIVCGATERIDKTKAATVRPQRCTDHRCNHHHAFNVFIDSARCSLRITTPLLSLTVWGFVFRRKFSFFKRGFHDYLHWPRIRILYSLISCSVCDLSILYYWTEDIMSQPSANPQSLRFPLDCPVLVWMLYLNRDLTPEVRAYFSVRSFPWWTPLWHVGKRKSV